MDMKNVRKLIAQDRGALIADIRRLVAVPSVGGGEPLPEAPFGAGPKAALDMFLKIGSDLGFRTWAFEHQVGIAEWGDESLPEMIAVLAHVDVVPAGEGWSCDPWEGMIKDNMLYGRGVADDKGPAVSALYALKALRDAGVRLKRRVRVLVGTNEELGSRAVDRYVKAGQELPVAGFTPDGEFPLINGEKGIITPACRAPFAPDGGSVQILSLDAGVAANAVPSKASAVLRVTPEAEKRLNRVISDFAAPRDASLHCEKTAEGEYTLTMEGLAFHGSRPQFGSNAAAHLVKVLRLLGIGGAQGAFLEKIDTLVGTQTRGENLGMLLYDDPSGFSSLCWGILKTEGTGPGMEIFFTLNYRFPVTFSLEPVKERLLAALTAAGFKTDRVRGTSPLYMSEDSDLVKTLMKVYQAETGDVDSRPMCIGGGTYAKEMPNMLAFGNQFPGENTHIHEVDECWSIDHIMTHTNIMASAIAALAGVQD